MADEETTEEVAEEVVEEDQEEAPAEETVEEVVEEKSKQTAQERINEITRLRRDAERRADRAEAQLRERETPATVQPTGRPTIDQYETTEKYEDALFEWRDKKTADKTAAVNLAKEQDEQIITFNTRAAELRKKHADFDDVVNSPVFTDTMRMAFLNSEKGPELAYHLGSTENVASLERIRRLPGHVQLMEVGKLESTLSFTKKTKTTTTAPDPLKPVGITGSGETDQSELSTDEWMKAEKEKDINKAKKKLGMLK